MKVITVYVNPEHISLVLGGGGIKGIAYLGVFEMIREYRCVVDNIAGVSAGALAGSFAAAGYKPDELKKILYEFDFSKIDYDRLHKILPVIQEYIEFAEGKRSSDIFSIYQFLGNDYLLKEGSKHAFKAEDFRSENSDEDEECIDERRGNFLKNIIKLSQKGSLFDGDYLEEWVSRTLAARGIYTFADLKVGIKNKENPQGYKIRMTAVDANRARILVLPDDIEYYGINPDNLEVAKAVRMSTCVPFAFKPVQIKKKKDNVTTVYNIFDGGLLDGFPSWIIGDAVNSTNIGFKLNGDNKNKIFTLSTSLDILKALISAVHDTGVPKKKKQPDYLGIIKTYNISFLDFNISINDKRLLCNQGRVEARRVLEKALKMSSLSRALKRNIVRKIQH